MTEDFSVWAGSIRTRLEDKAVSALTTADTGHLATLYEAMRYAVTGGGKRVRPLFAHAAGLVTGAREEALDEVSLAIEFIHAFSLVHDDLPCMDNDVLRRGKPTCHVKYGYAEAMLAGDALQPEAVLRITAMDLDPAVRVSLIDVLCRASGAAGMCGGQMIDLSNVGCSITPENLADMHTRKTGALISAAVRMGAMSGDPCVFRPLEQEFMQYASALGLAFQVVDDILDVTADTATLGKTAGKDADADKPTYVSLLGLDGARARARDCHAQARAALAAMEASGLVKAGSTMRMAQMADYVIGRTY